MIRKHDQYKIAGAILAGGQARRMGGIPKAQIKTQKGVLIIEHLFGAFRTAGICPIVILANNPRPYQTYGLDIFEDIRKGIGPLAGIETGLIQLAGKCDAVLFLPCDMPNLTAKEILTLKEAFVQSHGPVVCAETADFFWHPLCAVVHNDLLDAITAAIDRGERAVHDVWEQLGALGVRFSEAKPFLNLNTIAEFEQWRKDWNEKANVC